MPIDHIGAYDLVATQLSFGPRIPGSEYAKSFQDYLIENLQRSGWEAQKQQFSYRDVQLSNIIAKNSDEPPEIILGAHYDTRAVSDRDPIEANQSTPVPGANDGASGTAVLLELATHLVDSQTNIWLVFFDAEDQGHIDDWAWSVGARYFADQLENIPQEVIIIDMVGDKDLNIHLESNSSQEIANTIWGIADELGYGDQFIAEQKYAIIDDHLPFLDKGIPSVLIIDLDYPYWHTTQDILENISAASLQAVGNVLLGYIEQRSVP